MDTNALLSDDIFVDWLCNYDKKLNNVHSGNLTKTQSLYVTAFIKFTNFTEMSPTELIEEATADARSNKLLNEVMYLKRINRFERFLNSSNLSANTIKSYISGVRGFYKFNYIPLPNRTRMRVDKDRDQSNEHNLKFATKEDIKYFLDNCDNEKMKCIALIGCTSGLAISDILDLKLQDVLNVDYKNITTMKLMRRKTGVRFHTFLSPETTDAVLNYVRIRGFSNQYEGNFKGWDNYIKYDESETLTDDESKHTLRDYRINLKNKKTVFRTDKDYLFIKGNVSKNYLKNYDDMFRKFETHSYNEVLGSITLKLGLKVKDGTYPSIRSHNFRKYFYSTLINKGVSNFFADYMAGKTIPADKMTYINVDVENLKSIYKSCIPHLDFNTVTVTDSDFNELEIQLAVKDIEIEREKDFAVIDNEINKLNIEINKKEHAREKFKKANQNNNKVTPERMNEMMEMIDGMVNKLERELFEYEESREHLFNHYHGLITDKKLKMGVPYEDIK